jgi:hypothetical protein
MSRNDARKISPSRADASTEDYKPTQHEKSARQRFNDRKRQNPPSPRYKLKRVGKKATVVSEHPNPDDNIMLLTDTFATGNVELCRGLLQQVYQNTDGDDAARAQELNCALATVRGIAPRDETEALLAVQMAAIHHAAMMAARRLQRTETVAQQDSCSNMFNKLTRTFTMQLDVLKKYRSNGEQTIKVQHVHVNRGGQAIVGNVQTGKRGGGDTKSERQCHEPDPTTEAGCLNAASPAMLSHIEAKQVKMSCTSDEGQDCVPVSRGKGGRS